jgi:hypothetical protein
MGYSLMASDKAATILLNPVIVERVIELLEQQPNWKVVKFPESLQSSEDIDEYMVIPEVI